MSQALLAEGNALCIAKGQDLFLGVTWCDRGILALEDGAWATAARFFADSVAKLFGEWDTWYIARPLVGLALVAVEWGDVALAARLVGAGEACSARVGSFPHGVAGHQVAAVTARLQQIVPADELAELLREGHQTSLTKVLELVEQFAEREIEPRLNTGENAAGPRLRITKREVEVLALMAYKSDKEIADDLEISPRTVTTHVSHILSKLHAMSRSISRIWPPEWKRHAWRIAIDCRGR